MITKKIIGLPIAEAVKLCLEAHFKMRITVKDGQPFMVTRDFRTDRIDVTVSDGIVVSAKIG